MVKQLLTPGPDEGDLAAVQRAEHRYLLECWASPEHAEAVKAFTEKRPPCSPAEPTAQQLVSAGGTSRSMRYRWTTSPTQSFTP